MKTRVTVFILVLISTFPAVVRAGEYGKFIGSVKAEWLEDGRTMKLLEDFKYVDPQRIEWNAPLGWIVDGASIPQFAWSIIGGPFEGKYRNASVIHDVACDKREQPWEKVHQAFYNAMRASEVGKIKAKIMYAAVYHLGPRWPLRFTKIVPRSKAGTAFGKDMRLESPGSDISTYFTAIPRSFFEIITFQPGKTKIFFDVVPMAPQISEEDFSKLEQAITEKDLSLEDIRNFSTSQR